MNMQNIMAQAAKIKKDMEKKQAEIDSKIFEVQSEFVLIKMTGKRKLITLEINKQMIKDEEDVEALEDMLKVSFEQILSDIDKEIKKVMGAYGAGMDGLI